MISDKHKCIFVHIPKTAGGSVKYALGYKKPTSTKGLKRWAHATAAQIKKNKANEKQWDNYFKFAIVRNPFDRIVSAYNWHCRLMEPSNFRDRLLFKDFIYKKGRFKTQYINTAIIKKANKYRQVRAITDFVMDKNDNLLVDYIGRFENLKNEWEFICEKIGTEIELPHIHNSCRDDKHYRDYYDDETRKFVSEACEKDLETFGYEF
jgi:hypothetical protein